MSLESIINELVVTNVEKSMKFYEENFGFTIDMTDGDPIIWAQLKKDNLTLMLEEYNEVKTYIKDYPAKSNTSNIIKFEYSNLDEIKKIYKLLKDTNVEFFTEYTETDYGKAEFGVFDPDKNMILISAMI